VALAMKAPMQVNSSNSLIILAMASSPGAAPAKPQLGAGTSIPRRHADRWVYCPDEGYHGEPQAPVRGDTRDRADCPECSRSTRILPQRIGFIAVYSSSVITQTK
jgi:hypothetical protein